MAFWMWTQDVFNHLASDMLLRLITTYFSRYMYQFTVSNMIAQRDKAQWIIGGQPVEWISTIGSEAALSISIVTYNDIMKVCVCSDRGYSTLSKPLTQQIEMAMKQL